MKKLISGITALTMFSAMTMGVCADTVIAPFGGDPFNADPNPETADAVVEFEINPQYTVTIPAKVELTGNYGERFKGSGDITADGVFLEENAAIIVTLTSASKFNLSHEGEGDYTLPYTATGFFGTVDKENGRAVARFNTSTEASSITVSFETDEVPKFAGKYSDPVVFGIYIEKE